MSKIQSKLHEVDFSKIFTKGNMLDFSNGEGENYVNHVQLNMV